MKKIPLRNQKGDVVAEAIVDDEDYELVSQNRWHQQREGYAARRHWNKALKIHQEPLMHRIINGTPSGMHTDHINGDRLDNRRGNLRTCTRSQNQMNRSVQSNNKSGTTGVYWFKPAQLWTASIKVNRVQKSLGYFKTKDEAIAARRVAEKLVFGDFAVSKSRKAQ